MICTIYKIYNDIDEDTYIGSTTQTPSRRLNKHKSDSKTISPKTGKMRQSLLHVKMRLTGVEHFSIEIIEQYAYIGDETERFVLEQDYIDSLQPTLNQKRAYLTDEERKEYKKEYREENKEQIKEQNKKYYEEHKEEIIQKVHEYRKQPYICLICNVSITRHSKARHERSNQHITNLNTPTQLR